MDIKLRSDVTSLTGITSRGVAMSDELTGDRVDMYCVCCVVDRRQCHVKCSPSPQTPTHLNQILLIINEA